MATIKADVVEVRLTWWTEDRTRYYALWTLDNDDQLAMAGNFEQGPFDTALDAAQWAWRAIARVVPPSAC